MNRLERVSSRRSAPGGLVYWIEDRYGRLGKGLIGFVAGGFTLVIMGVIAWATDLPWLFPSLAPTVILVYEGPLRPPCSPRHTIAGHGIAIAVAYGCLAVFGLLHAPAATLAGVTFPRIWAVALSAALTALLLQVTNCSHPPAGASTLIVSMGIIHQPDALMIMFLAVVLLTAIAWTVNRLAGVEVPVWSPRSVRQTRSTVQ